MQLRQVITGVSIALLVSSAAAANPPEASSPPDKMAPASDAPVDASSSGPRRTANAFYFEGLGPGIFYSLNYDRRLGDFAARVGFGYVPPLAGRSSSSSTAAATSGEYLTFPLSLSYLGIGSQSHLFELGAGATIFYSGAGGANFDGVGSGSFGCAATVLLLPAALVGYRLQPPGGGFLFRVGVSTLVVPGGDTPVLPWPYLALGGAFG